MNKSERNIIKNILAKQEYTNRFKKFKKSNAQSIKINRKSRLEHDVCNQFPIYRESRKVSHLSSIIIFVEANKRQKLHSLQVSCWQIIRFEPEHYLLKRKRTRERERGWDGKSEIQISRWRSQIVRMNSRIDKQRIEELWSRW